MSELAINRIWAMPSKHTFKIKPISDLLKRYVPIGGDNWIDPFAGHNSPAEFTNDLNPNTPTKFHKLAKDFILDVSGPFDGCLLDPPYNLSQAKECYETKGFKLPKEDANRFPQNIKELLTERLKFGAIAITFGWNSQGFGKNLGFKMIEVLLVPHGRSHHDTIVTVEIKG